MFSDWLKLLKESDKNNYSTQGFICPECGQRSIEYIYVGDLDSIKQTIPNFKQVVPDK